MKFRYQGGKSSSTSSNKLTRPGGPKQWAVMPSEVAYTLGSPTLPLSRQSLSDLPGVFEGFLQVLPGCRPTLSVYAGLRMTCKASKSHFQIASKKQASRGFCGPPETCRETVHSLAWPRGTLLRLPWYHLSHYNLMQKTRRVVAPRSLRTASLGSFSQDIVLSFVLWE